MNGVRPEVEALTGKLNAFNANVDSQLKNVQGKLSKYYQNRRAMEEESRRIRKSFNTYNEKYKNAKYTVYNNPNIKTQDNALEYLKNYVPKSGLFTSKKQRINNGIKAFAKYLFDEEMKLKNNATRRRTNLNARWKKLNENIKPTKNQRNAIETAIKQSYKTKIEELGEEMKKYFPPKTMAEKNIIESVLTRLEKFVTTYYGYRGDVYWYINDLKNVYRASFPQAAPVAPRPAPVYTPPQEEEVSQEELEEYLGDLATEYRQEKYRSKSDGSYYNLTMFAENKGLNEEVKAALRDYMQDYMGPQTRRNRGRRGNTLKGNPGYSRINQGF